MRMNKITFFFMQIDVGSDNDDNSSDETLSIDKTRPASLDKMIALVATLVERSRGPDLRLQLSPRDYNAIAGGKVNSRKYLLKYFTDPYFIYKTHSLSDYFARVFHFYTNKSKTISIRIKHGI